MYKTFSVEVSALNYNKKSTGNNYRAIHRVQERDVLFIDIATDNKVKERGQPVVFDKRLL